VRLFALMREHTARELGSAAVNANGEASLETEAPEEVEALVLLGTPPRPLLIGLCNGQDSGALLDVKNAALAIAQRLRTPEHRPEPVPKAPEKPQVAPSKPVCRAQEPPPLPREIFLPAIDPAPYTAAALSKEPEEEPLLPPPRPTGPPVERLKKLRWPQGFEALEKHFESGMPKRLFPLPGWRFVQAAQGLCVGMQAQDGKVRRVAYAYAGGAPKEIQERCRSMNGLDGQTYQVLWLKV